jgi:hypothetical protein
MDVNLIKQRLEALNKKTSYKTNNNEVFWSPSIGKQTVRVVPSKFNRKDPFKDMFFYYDFSKTVASPTNWGGKDPVIEFCKKLKSTDDPENWNLAKKLYPKKRTYIPVIIRGEEDKGVRLWGFGKTILTDLWNLVDDEEIGDYTDIFEGRDLKLNTVGPDVTGTKYNKTTVSISLKESPLHEDEDTIKLWLNNQPDPLEAFHKFSFDEIKGFLQEFLTGESEDKDSSEEEEIVTKAPRVIKPQEVIKNPKISKEEKFNAMFDENPDFDDDSIPSVPQKTVNEKPSKQNNTSDLDSWFD